MKLNLIIVLLLMSHQSLLSHILLYRLRDEKGKYE
jgi:hypothetical protein